MNPNIPKPQLILEFEHFYSEHIPENRIDLIKHVPTKALLYELTGLNYRLKPKTKVHFNDSLEFQIKELQYFLKDPNIYNKYASVAEVFSKDKHEYPLFFTRQGCIFAIEEILNSNYKSETKDEDFGTLEHWESIVKYILAVNSEITKIKNEKDDNKIDFESLNPKFIPLNELGIQVDPIYTPYRGYHLIKYFLNEEDYRDEIIEYFQREYSLEPEEFIMNILRLYIANSSENPDYNFFYKVTEKDSNILESLSKRTISNDNYKLINVRKNPFIKVDTLKYVISDNTFLLEKCYSQFINDFWFDHLKNIKNKDSKSIYNIQKYRSDFGYFFESYLNSIFRYAFAEYKHATLLTFDQLKITTNQGDIELADLYLRYNNKVLIGQVKSGNIYDTEKYGGDLETLYKKDRNKFFENFGVNQIIASINNINEHINKLDSKFPKGHQLKFYPFIVVNDKALQTPLMADIFNSRFSELEATIKIHKIVVKPLSLIHISDLETIEESLKNNPREIWNYFDENHKFKSFIPPFYNSVFKIWNYKKYPKKIIELYKELIEKYMQQ